MHDRTLHVLLSTILIAGAVDMAGGRRLGSRRSGLAWFRDPLSVKASLIKIIPVKLGKLVGIELPHALTIVSW